MQTQFIKIDYWELIKGVSMWAWGFFFGFLKLFFSIFLSSWKFFTIVILILLIMFFIKKLYMKKGNN